jgi:hypothetical protein
MPKIYKYLGYIFFFYSNDHKPRHVHVQKGNIIMKVEIEDNAGMEVVKFINTGEGLFSSSEQYQIQLFINMKREGIVKKWDLFFLEKKKPKFEKLNCKLKKKTIVEKVFRKK